jgi:glycosyltransferase involved in cell wall biosynthesis
MTAVVPRVVVLMSTYRGERFVGEQLRSILSQLPPQGQVMVRDDGSGDGTGDAVQAVGDSRVTLTRGANLGFGRSFLTLLAQVPPEADMVMFSDQDDVWLPDKVDRAWRHLCKFDNRPALYGSAQLLVDAALNPLHPTPPWPRGPSLANALMENIITGCTAALNRPAVDLLRRAGVPDGVHFHDWWLYLVVSAFGTVVYDDQPVLLYRQHGGNVIGHGAGWLGRRLGMLRFLCHNDWIGILQHQVGAFLKHYDDALPPRTADWIRRYFRVTNGCAIVRWRLLFTARRWRQSLAHDAALRVLLLAHKLGLWPLPGRRL